MKSLGFLICLSVFAPSSMAQNQPDIIEIPLKQAEGRPTFQMSINGKGPFVFIFDTGKMGEEIVVNEGVARQFNFQQSDSLRMGDPSGKNTIVLPVVIIPWVNSGKFRVENVRAIVDARPLPEVVGIVGLPFFKKYLLTLDLKHNKLILSNDTLAVVDDETILNYRSRMGIPELKIKIGTNEVNAHLDCGNAREAIVVPESLAIKLTFAETPASIGPGRTLFNRQEMKKGRIKENLYLGRYTFTQPIICFPGFGDFVNLGEKFLREFIVSFDQENERLKLIRN